MAEVKPLVSLETVQQIGTQIMPDISLSAFLTRERIFNKLGIKVISGDEFQNVRYALRMKGHTTRQKKLGDSIKSEMGKLEERKLVTYVAWNRYPLNKMMFRELPRQIGEQLMYPESEKILKGALQNYTNDLFDNLFFGDHLNHELPEGNAMKALGLYDGFWTYLANDIKDGFLKPIHLSAAITRPTSTADTQAWDLFVEFMDKLDPTLAGLDFKVLCSPATAAAIYAAYGHAHGDHKEMGIAANGNYTIPEYPNVEIAFDPVVGVGCRLVATIDGNFEYGVDTLDPENKMSIEKETSVDNDNWVMQPSSAQGTRVFDVSPRAFAMTDAAMTFRALSGDYRDVNLIVASSDSAKGTVKVNDADPDNNAVFTPGQIVTLKAVNVSGTFQKWLPGNQTDAEISIVVGADTEAYTAVFA